MKKNFIERHMIWVGLILFCFMVVPSVKDSYCQEKESASTPVVTSSKIEKEDTKIKVVIDPGHGGYDSGSESHSGVIEKELTLKIAQKVGAILENKNIEVIYTRQSDKVTWSTDNAQDLLARTEIANGSGAACFVSIHLNFSDEYQDEISGNEIWVNYENDQNVRLAEAIDTQLQTISKSDHRGLKDQSISPLSLLVYNEIPSVLVETGFLSNDEDTAYVSSDEGSDAFAAAIANGILAYVEK